MALLKSGVKTEQGRLDVAQALWQRFAQDVAEEMPLQAAKSRLIAGIQVALRGATQNGEVEIEV